MDQREYNTKGLWTNFMSLLNLVVFLIFFAFMFLALEDQIRDFINRPKYDLEEIAKLSEQRENNRRIAREDNWDLVENGIHVKTGLRADKDLQLIIGACTPCHSAKLITQNSATRAGWKNMIVWMQETQGLQDLGLNEPRILDYLAKYYAPKDVGRRENLDLAEIKWYILDLQ